MSTNLKILFKLTTRSRPQLAYKTLKSIIDNLSNYNDFFIAMTIDNNDPHREEYRLVLDKCREGYAGVGANMCGFDDRNSISKIDAINRDMDRIGGWDILLNVSDDQVFIKKGFDEIIREQFSDRVVSWTYTNLGEKINERNEPNLDFFLHFPDGNRSDLATMSIMGRDYYERDGYIYNPIYANEYCDNEAQDVAKIRGCYKFVNEQIFDHLHGNYGKGEFDLLHKSNAQKGFINYDAKKYHERKLNNFGL